MAQALKRSALMKAAAARLHDRTILPTADESARHLETCRACPQFTEHDPKQGGAPTCAKCTSCSTKIVRFVLPRARFNCPLGQWRWGAAASPIQPPDRSRPGLGDARRVLIFHRAGYRWAELNKNYGHLARDGWDTKWVRTGNYAPPVDEVKALVKRYKPVAVIRWEEHGTLFVNRTWMASLDHLYSVGVIPLSMDCGYFDHWRTQMIDQYMPNGSSSIKRDWDYLATDVDWNRFDPRVRAYRQRVLDSMARVEATRPIAEPGYVALWLQFSAQLAKPKLRPKGTDAYEWAKRAINALTRAGLQVIVKAPPVSLGCKKDPAKLAIPEKAWVFKHKARGDLNAQIMRGAAWSVAISSSVSNEHTILWQPMTMVGRSFFSRMGVFHEPADWRGITKPPVVDVVARAKWINWWAEHQFYAEHVSPILDGAIRRAQERGSGS